MLETAVTFARPSRAVGGVIFGDFGLVLVSSHCVSLHNKEIVVMCSFSYFVPFFIDFLVVLSASFGLVWH